MEESNKPQDLEPQAKKPDTNPTITIGSEPVMESAIYVLTVLGTNDQITLYSKGNSIPNAVAVANIITEKMLRKKSEIQKITLDTESAAGIGKMTSTIHIVLCKL